MIKNSETLTMCPVPENSSPKGHSPKLFVFGDSYVDTGNLQPFRSSGGCVLTDYIGAQLLLFLEIISFHRFLFQETFYSSISFSYVDILKHFLQPHFSV